MNTENKKRKEKALDISVVIPMRNSSSTITETLNGIKKQTYPIREIIIVDNASTDDSVTIVKKYITTNKHMRIQLLLNKKDMMIAWSLERGITTAKSPYVVLTHADCQFVSPNEIKKLIRPIISDNSIIATYGQISQPESFWNKYSFWEKCLFAQTIGKKIPGLTGKVDCFEKKAWLAIGGHAESTYGPYGGEDANFHLRLKKTGKIIQTDATIEHLHYMYEDFSLKDLFVKRQQTAQAYGRLLRFHGINNGLKGFITFLTKPILAMGAIIPGINLIMIPTMMLFIFLYYRKIFTTPSTLFDLHILLLPFVAIFLIYFETFWTVYAFMQPIKRQNRVL